MELKSPILLFKKESFTNSNETLDIIAFSKTLDSNELIPFSNCSSLNFIVKTKEINPVFDAAPLNLDYSDLIKAISKEFENHFYKENLEKYQQNIGAHSDYIHHIFDDDLTDNDLNKLFVYYKNFGVCNRVTLQMKNSSGDQILHVIYKKFK